MSYVPVTYVPPPSHRALELSERIRRTIEEYRRTDPGTTPTDVDQALRLAARGRGGSQAAATIVAGLLVLFLFGALFFWRGGGFQSWPLITIVIGAILLVGLAAAAFAAARR